MLGGIETLLYIFGDRVWFKELCIGTRLTKGRLVMIYFICQLNWAMGCLHSC